MKFTGNQIRWSVDIGDSLWTFNLRHGVPRAELGSFFREAQVGDVSQLVLSVVCDTQVTQH